MCVAYARTPAIMCVCVCLNDDLIKLNQNSSVILWYLVGYTHKFANIWWPLLSLLFFLNCEFWHFSFYLVIYTLFFIPFDRASWNHSLLKFKFYFMYTFVFLYALLHFVLKPIIFYLIWNKMFRSGNDKISVQVEHTSGNILWRAKKWHILSIIYIRRKTQQQWISSLNIHLMRVLPHTHTLANKIIS